MKFQIKLVALVAALLPLATAVPADSVGSIEQGDANLMERQQQYSCASHQNNLGECNAAIEKLRGHEARGCDIWACIGAFATVIPACGAAIDELFLNPVADLACIGAVGNFQGPCANCEPF